MASRNLLAVTEFQVLLILGGPARTLDKCDHLFSILRTSLLSGETLFGKNIFCICHMFTLKQTAEEESCMSNVYTSRSSRQDAGGDS